MTNPIEQKALALVNEVSGREWAVFSHADPWTLSQALCRAIEQHEAFRQEVSDAVVEYFGAKDLDVILAGHSLARFIIAKPDPLVVEAREICARVCEGWVDIPKNRAAAYRDGVHDDEADFAYVLNALRKANERPTHD